MTFAEVVERVRNIATGLYELGVRRGDTVGLMLLNRPEFNLCDCAAMHLGATPFSIYNTCSARAGRLPVRQCRQQGRDHRAAVLGDDSRRRSTTRAHVCVDGAARALWRSRTSNRSQSPGFDFEATWRAVTGEDLITICYTSGTTGPPKGVELTHANVLAECRAAASDDLRGARGRIVSYLPHAHMADRYSAHYSSMLYGLAGDSGRGSTRGCCGAARRASDELRLGATSLGEDEGGPRGGDRGR